MEQVNKSLLFQTRNELSQFGAEIKKLVKKGDFHKLSRKGRRELNKKVYHLIRGSLNRLQGEASIDLDTPIVQKFIDKAYWLKSMASFQKETLAVNLINEATLLDYEAGKFIRISITAIHQWWAACLNTPLNRNQGSVLLSVIIGESYMGNANVNQVAKYSGLNRKAASKILGELVELNLIWLDDTAKKGKLFTAKLPKQYSAYPKLSLSGEIFSNAALADWGIINDFKEDTYAGYIYSKPNDLANPFLTLTGDTVFVHSHLLRSEFILSCLLSTEQINDWLSLSHGTASIMVGNIKNRIVSFLSESLTSRPRTNDRHYWQIEQILPVLKYVGTRAFSVDEEELVKKIFYLKYIISSSAQRFSERREAAGEMQEPYQWDSAYFWDCLTKLNPSTHWKLRYPDVSIQFFPGDLEAVFNPDLVTLPSDWTLEDVLKICPQIFEGDEIEILLKSSSDLKIIESLNQRLKEDQKASLSFVPSILENSTHGNFLVNRSPQNFPSSIKQLFRPRPGHVFLMVDISQNHLEVLKAYSKRFSQIGTGTDYDALTFDHLATELGIPRNAVKDAIYLPLNGASKNTVLRNSGLSPQSYDKLIKRLNDIPEFGRFYTWVTDVVNSEGVTPPTPLGYRIPVYQNERLAAGYLIHASANEISRAWILKLHRDDKSHYIVNTIHDEILFEIPEYINLYKFSIEVRDNLVGVASSLLPGCNMDLKVGVGKRWSKEDAIKLHLPEKSG